MKSRPCSNVSPSHISAFAATAAAAFLLGAVTMAERARAATNAGSKEESLEQASADFSDPSPVRHPRSYQLEGKQPFDPPFTTFADIDRWSIEQGPEPVSVQIFRGELQKMWQPTNLKLAIKPEGEEKAGSFFLRPPHPITIDKPFDTFSMWMFSEVRTAQKTGAKYEAEFTDAEGKSVRIPIPYTDHPGTYREGWTYVNRRLDHAVKVPAKFEGFLVSNITQPDVMYWDSPSVYLRRGQESTGNIPEWSEVGAPTRPDTILPRLAEEVKFTNRIEQRGEDFVFTYDGDDEKIRFVYRPETGTLSDISVETDGGSFRPLWEGGWVLVDRAKERAALAARTTASGTDGDSLKAVWDAGVAGNRVYDVDMTGTKRTLVKAEIDGDTLRTVWHWKKGDVSFESTLDLKIRQKSLVIETSAETDEVAQLSLGKAAFLEDPILTEVPYLTLWNHYTTRPGKNPREVNPRVLLDRGIFYFPFIDWYHSEASELFSDTELTEVEGQPAAIVNGGSAYLPKTDGKRNQPRERVFLNVSSRFDEVLPVVANPPNPLNDTTKSVIWSTRAWYPLSLPWLTYYDQEYSFWRKMFNYGARDLAVRYHTSSFRAYSPSRFGDSYGIESSLDPQIGRGDEGFRTYARQMRDDFGYRTGHYINYTLVCPMNPDNWKEEWVSLDPSGQLNPAGEVWAYMGKISQAGNMLEHAGPRREAAWDADLSYSDQVTAHPPWRFVDYDASEPEAGKFSGVIRAFAKALRDESRFAKGGPVLSEGIHQWFYAGFSDSYAQPTRGSYGTIPNFQLSSPHLLSNDTGYNLEAVAKADDNKEESANFVLANQILFGHTGHLLGVYMGETPQTPGLQTIRSYFLMKQLQELYANEPVKEILYFNGSEMVPIERAILEKVAEQDARVHIRYANGLGVWVNRHPDKNWPVKTETGVYLLPPNGWVAELPGKFLTYSALVNGHRVDYAHGPEYSFFNPNGREVDFGIFKSSAAYVVRSEGGITQVIPVPEVRAGDNVALDLRVFRPDLLDKGIEVRPVGDGSQPMNHEFSDGKLNFSTIGPFQERFEISEGITWPPQAGKK
jgi:hypothetical protein